MRKTKIKPKIRLATKTLFQPSRDLSVIPTKVAPKKAACRAPPKEIFIALIANAKSNAERLEALTVG
ncbi:hypothetical protein D3C72_2310880 [compost metagenome]